jgi:Domain of unknown function (DUF1996)
MRNGRLHWVAVLVFALAGCGGDEGETTAASDSAFTLLSPPTPTPAVASVAALPATVLNTPFIDNTKIPAAVAGFSDARIKAATEAPKQNSDGTGQFRFTCDFSHMSYDDPIVFPGKQGAAHLHTFFGNAGINYASTQASIETSGNSSCAGGTANRTGYWVPAVIDTKDGTPIKPSKILVYYKSDLLPGASVKPFPAGLRMIAGDMKSAAAQNHTDWGCIGPNGVNEQRFKSIPTDCPVGYTVEATIEFPTCWDGVNLDAPDHKSHMAFAAWDNDARKTSCPKSHPVQVPTLTEKIQYTVAEAGSTARWRLSSDNYSKDLPGGYSIHADWFNGWDPKVQDIWLKNCLQAARDCHGSLLGNGSTLF